MSVWTLNRPDRASLDIDANESEKRRAIGNALIAVPRQSRSQWRIANMRKAGLNRVCGPPLGMPVKGQLLFAAVMQKALGAAVAVTLAIGIMSVGAVAQVEFASKQKAFTQGYSAFKSGHYDIAVPALKFAAKRNVMRAKFYLAKIYSDNSGGFTDHARAYLMLRDIVSSYAHVDPKDFRIAPFISKALTSIARYERDGIAELKLRPSTQRALQFFDHAASHFNDKDAQFELAKHYLAGDGVEARVPYALNWLARLSKRGHAGAQAFLADLYWDGRHTVVRDRVRALALITVAVENVREEDRFWIEDLHQNIFCEASRKTRLRVHEVVGGWRRRFGRTRTVSNRETDLAELGGGTRRVCANGDIVGDLDAPAANRSILNGFNAAAAGATIKRGQQSTPDAKPGGTKMTRMKGNGTDRSNLNGFALRESSAKDRSSKSDPVGTTPAGRNRSLNGFGTTNYGLPRP